MENLGLVVEGVVLVIAAILIGWAVYENRKAGNKEIPWDKIRPILTDAFLRIQEVKEAEKIGYQALEDYAVAFIMGQIKKADFLSDVERALISADLIRSIVGPRLKEIYEANSTK